MHSREPKTGDKSLIKVCTKFLSIYMYVCVWLDNSA